MLTATWLSNSLEFAKNMNKGINNQLLFSTSTGLILGDIVFYSDKGVIIEGISSRNEMKVSNDDGLIDIIFEDLHSKNIDMTQLIILKNVTIMHNDNKNIKLPFHVLFIDQINGISIGNLD